VFEDWTRRTGTAILDGIGTTELLHIFISNRLEDAAPGATGRPVTGYEAMIVDDDMKEVPDGTIGHLAVRGPTGCRYLADDRQTGYVRDGLNLTGDDFLRDQDGVFHFVARADDMIISSGYNIAGPEVEAALLTHAEVAECAVIGAPDLERGQIVEQLQRLVRSGLTSSRARRQERAQPASSKPVQRQSRVSASRRMEQFRRARLIWRC
jgi:2-aminobenzoate-CoA ligase